MKNIKKLLALLLVVVMVAALFVGCQENPTTTTGGKDTTPPDTKTDTTPVNTDEQPPETTEPEETVAPLEDDPRLAVEAFEYSPEGWYDESDKLYDETLGEYYEYYQKSFEATSLSERYALQAIAEAKLLGSAIMIPTTTKGGNYAITRVVPRTANTTLWGNDSDRFHNVVVLNDFLTPELRDEVKAKWAELKGTGTFEAWVREFVVSKGYEIQDTYTLGYTSDPQTWDPLNTYRSADSEAIVNTYDGLLEYDLENVQQPAIAESYTVSDDGTVYTFKIRQGVVWTDSQGRKVADLTADDFVAALQHLLDAQGGLETLAADDGAKILNAQKYIDGEITDFAEVGVKALDEYTLEYTLEENVPFFTSMLGYNIFAPMSRSYYTSQGGKFGAEYDAEDPNYLYGKDPDHIAYCGPYLVTNATEANTIVFQANPQYWNKDGITIKTITWLYNDGSDDLKAYNDAKAGTIAGCGLNTSAAEAAKKDGLFDKYAYISDTDATSYMAFFNINRKAYANFNDASVGVSTKTMYDAERYNLAMQNVHFRRAMAASLDRGSYNAQSVGEELKYNNLRNSYVPGNFVSLPEEYTVEINGTNMTFPAGTNYGEIVQAQLDADGVAFKVWDPEADNGLGSGDGYDGWYNPEYAKAELAIAIEELAKVGVIISKENPIVMEIPYQGNSEVRTNRANVFKQSFETTLDNCVEVRLLDCIDQPGWLYAGYYPDFGYQMNADLMDVSGWGPDYGDPQTYLATMTPAPGGMVKSCGMY